MAVKWSNHLIEKNNEVCKEYSWHFQIGLINCERNKSGQCCNTIVGCRNGSVEVGINNYGQETFDCCQSNGYYPINLLCEQDGG